MSDIDKRLEAILAHYAGFCSVSWDKDKVFQTENVLKENTKVKQAIKQLMADEFEKLIGEDDKYIEGYHTVPQEEINACNELRDELRQKLQEWLKDE